MPGVSAAQHTANIGQYQSRLCGNPTKNSGKVGQALFAQPDVLETVSDMSDFNQESGLCQTPPPPVPAYPGPSMRGECLRVSNVKELIAAALHIQSGLKLTPTLSEHYDQLDGQSPPPGSTPLTRTLQISLIMGQEECHATEKKVQRRVQA
jgi:hypothetical protein